MCRPSKIDGRCEIRLYLLKTLILYIKLYANYTEGLHFSAFIIVSNVAELSIAIDYEEPILTVESMIHH